MLLCPQLYDAQQRYQQRRNSSFSAGRSNAGSGSGDSSSGSSGGSGQLSPRGPTVQRPRERRVASDPFHRVVDILHVSGWALS